MMIKVNLQICKCFDQINNFFSIAFCRKAIVEDDNIMNNINNNNMKNGRSMDSIGSYSSSPTRNMDEIDEKARLISQVLELQNTLDGN